MGTPSNTPFDNVPNEMAVTWGGASVVDLVNFTPANWVRFSYTEVATSDLTTISFSGWDNYVFLGLDNVNVEAIPSPPLFSSGRCWAAWASPSAFGGGSGAAYAAPHKTANSGASFRVPRFRSRAERWSIPPVNCRFCLPPPLSMLERPDSPHL